MAITRRMPDSPGISNLPPELFHTITKHCSDSKDTLGSMRLVCKAWGAFADPLLFERLCIKPKPLNAACEAFLSRRDRLPLPLARHIRHIVFEDDLLSSAHRNLPRTEGGGMDHSLDIAIYFQSILGLLSKGKITQVISLGLFFHHYSGILTNRHLRNSLSFTFSNIVDLNLRFRKDKLPDVIRFMCSFPQLETLGLLAATSGSDLRDLPGPIVVGYTLPESVQTIHLGLPDDQLTFDYFNDWISFHPPRSIHRLSVLQTRWLDLDPFALLCGRTLKILSLNFHYWSSNAHNSDLSNFRNLETLSIDLPQTPSFKRLSRTLNSLSSNRFRKLTIVISYNCLIPAAQQKLGDDDQGTTPTLPSFNSTLTSDKRKLWKKLDEILCSSSKLLSTGRCATVNLQVLSPPRDFRGMEAEARRLLKKCDVQQCLEVTPVDVDGERVRWDFVERYRLRRF
ncbi:hypothetical protein L218DRAFT_1002223 [Marasmius fiardii PR-910]|nr:hypothetical protein L218DRAFT_1002223 [Marasmius fiardii PR-910]